MRYAARLGNALLWFTSGYGSASLIRSLLEWL